MSLRPRYSLLTLLVLTALIAGGVKLWRGPHHVFDRLESPAHYYEIEYDFLRTWNAARMKQGPQVLRKYELNGTLESITLSYHRQGEHLPSRYYLFKRPLQENVDSDTENRVNFPPDVLHPDEVRELQLTVTREKQRDPGAGWKWAEEFFP